MVQRFHQPIVFGNQTTPKTFANFIDGLTVSTAEDSVPTENDTCSSYHRHLAPLPADFTDTRTALQFFFSASVFSSFQLSLFPSVLIFLSKVSHLSHNHLFLDFYFFTFLVPLNIFSFFLVYVLD